MSIEPRASDSCDYSAGITSPLASCPARNTRSRRTNNTGKVNGTQPGKQGKRKMKEPSPPKQVEDKPDDSNGSTPKDVNELFEGIPNYDTAPGVELLGTIAVDVNESLTKETQEKETEADESSIMEVDERDTSTENRQSPGGNTDATAMVETEDREQGQEQQSTKKEPMDLSGSEHITVEAEPVSVISQSSPPHPPSPSIATIDTSNLNEPAQTSSVAPKKKGKKPKVSKKRKSEDQDNNDQGTAGTSVPCVQTDTSIMTETKESVWAQIHATKASTSAIQDQDRIQDEENEGNTKEGSKFKGKDNREEIELDTRERPCCVVTKIPEEKRPDKPTFVMSNAVSRCKYSSLEVSVAWAMILAIHNIYVIHCSRNMDKILNFASEYCKTLFSHPVNLFNRALFLKGILGPRLMFDVFNMAARCRKIGIPGKKTRDKVIQQSVEQRKTKAFDRLKEMQETGDQETKDMVSNLFQDLKNLKDIPTNKERLEKLADILNDNVFADTLTATPLQTGAESEIIALSSQIGKRPMCINAPQLQAMDAKKCQKNYCHDVRQSQHLRCNHLLFIVVIESW